MHTPTASRPALRPRVYRELTWTKWWREISVQWALHVVKGLIPTKLATALSFGTRVPALIEKTVFHRGMSLFLCAYGALMASASWKQLTIDWKRARLRALFNNHDNDIIPESHYSYVRWKYGWIECAWRLVRRHERLCCVVRECSAHLICFNISHENRISRTPADACEKSARKIAAVLRIVMTNDPFEI